MPINHVRLGLLFALVAVIFWGVLPLALKLTAGFIDPVTLTWYRFLVAFIVTLGFQLTAGNLGQFKTLPPQAWLILVMGSTFSIGNYLSMVYALEYLAPGPAQLYFQTAPFFLAFGGVMVFKEKFNISQGVFFTTLAFGLMVFFHSNLALSMLDANGVVMGILIVQFSALSWSIYALVQRYLIKYISPSNILLFIYAYGIVAMMPFIQLSYFTSMDNDEWLIAIFCAANTIIAYQCFAQSMKYASTLQVGAMVALTPIFSFIFTAVVAALGWWPDVIQGKAMDMYEVIGIILVVLSVVGVQLFPKKS